ncbi:MAG: hypothetical protein JWP81_2491 [Ferruginibacter sp.]|nr:hypothetical protein [Ferruginibacter sp.]
MNNKNILPALFALLMMGSLCSCKKYLDKKSNTSLVTPSTLRDLQGILDNLPEMNLQTPAFGEASADDYFLLPATYDAQALLQQKAYTWSVDLYNHPNDWGYSYNTVFDANFCLEQVAKVERTEQNKQAWDNVKGSALFYRGYSFLNLAWVFAKSYDEANSPNDAGIVLRLGSDFNQPSKRATVKETYDQVTSDINAAWPLLPDLPQHVVRPSKAAAYALLARVWLSMQRYDSAYKYADLALQLKHDLLDYNNTSEITASSTAPFKPFNVEVLFYTTMSNGFSVKTPGTALIDSLLFNSYHNNDKRKTIFFRTSGLYRRFKGSYASSSTTLFTGIAVDELYLVRAECLARLGRVPEAMTDLNSLLEKRWATGTFVPFTAGSQSAAIALILEERRKELLMRGLRWPDIKRYNAAGAQIVPTRVVGRDTFRLQPNERRYALPLPSDIIQLTGMEQN